MVVQTLTAEANKRGVSSMGWFKRLSERATSKMKTRASLAWKSTTGCVISTPHLNHRVQKNPLSVRSAQLLTLCNLRSKA